MSTTTRYILFAFLVTILIATGVCEENLDIPCVTGMDLAQYDLLTTLARKFDQAPFDHLVGSRMRYHFDEKFAQRAQSHDNSAMIFLFIYPLSEDWGQELINASLKVWFGSNAGKVATIKMGEMNVDQIRRRVYEVINECEYTVIRFLQAELQHKTAEVIQLLQDVRHLELPGKKTLDGSKAIYFFELGLSDTHEQRPGILQASDQYRAIVKNSWGKYLETIGLVQNVTNVMLNSTFSNMLGSRMRVSVVPFLPIPQESVKTYLTNKLFDIIEFNTDFNEQQYLALIIEQNPGIKVYKYMDNTDCNVSPYSLPCLRAQCDKLTCNEKGKRIQVVDKEVKCTCK